MKHIRIFFFYQKSRKLFGFIFLLIATLALGSDSTLFHCDESDWNDFTVYTQTHNEEVRTCLLNEIKNKGERYLKTPYNCYFYVAETYYHQTDHENCTHHIRKALNATTKASDSTRALLLLSHTCRANDNISTAQGYTLQALNIAQKNSLYEESAYAYIELARINYTLKDSLKAVEYLNRAEKSIGKTENLKLKGTYYYQKARVQFWYEGKTDLDEIVEKLLKSLNYSEAAKNYVAIGTTLDFLGSCYWHKAEYGEAQVYYERGMSIKKMLGNTYGQAISHNNLATLSYMQSNIPQAIKFYKKSAELSEDIGAFELLESTYVNTAMMYEANKQPDSTIVYFRKKIAVMDTLQRRQRAEFVYDLQTKYETREKEQQIKAQKQQLYYLGLAAGLLAFIVGLIYFLYQQKSRLNKIIGGQKKELEQLNTFKNQLFSIMGHDLRGMMSKLNMSQRKIIRTQAAQDNEAMSQSISKMGAIIDGLNGFIENILYWGFTQTNRLHFSHTKLNVSNLIEQVAYNFKYDLEQKNITLHQDMPDDFDIHADLNTTKVVLRNLLANAIKYSNSDSKITIKGIEENQHKLIQVIDEGQGIPPEKIPILFEVNNQKVAKGTAGEKGTGLGLWLCKEMMQKNKGTIEVKSQLGQGTIFTLRFE